MKIYSQNDVSETNVQKFSDKRILELAQKYGAQAHIWRQRFAGLLPEINRRKLFEKKGCSSIFEFAKKLAGMSEEQVRTVLNLEKKFSDKPVLHQLLIDGEVSANKLVRVASIATLQNQQVLANQVQILSNRALETFVKDEKIARGLTAFPEDSSGSSKPLFEVESLHVQRFSQSIPDDVKLVEKFSPELKNKLKELDSKGLNIDQILLELLEKREEEIRKEENEICESDVFRRRGIPQRAGRKAEKCEAECMNKKPKPTRNLNVATQKFLDKKFGNKCSIPSCIKLAEEIHHAQRWALAQNHDPHYFAPLCTEHHQIAHSIDVKFQEKRRFF